jgi:hypothetical protein
MIIANPVATKPVLTNQERGIGLGDSFSRILFCFMIMLVVSILIFAKAWEAVRAENLTLKFFYRPPCRKCHFFAQNHYLLCTVHPYHVLTEQALDCSDYHPLIEN